MSRYGWVEEGARGLTELEPHLAVGVVEGAGRALVNSAPSVHFADEFPTD